MDDIGETFALAKRASEQACAGRSEIVRGSSVPVACSDASPSGERESTSLSEVTPRVLAGRLGGAYADLSIGAPSRRHDPRPERAWLRTGGGAGIVEREEPAGLRSSCRPLLRFVLGSSRRL